MNVETQGTIFTLVRCGLLKGVHKQQREQVQCALEPSCEPQSYPDVFASPDLKNQSCCEVHFKTKPGGLNLLLGPCSVKIACQDELRLISQTS